MKIILSNNAFFFLQIGGLNSEQCVHRIESHVISKKVFYLFPF